MNPLLLEQAPAPAASPVEFDTSGWPTSEQVIDEIFAEELMRVAQEELDQVEGELRDVLATVEEAAEPITGPIPVSIPLTKADAYRGTFEAVLTEVCDRLAEIRRTRRTSEIADVVAMLQALI